MGFGTFGMRSGLIGSGLTPRGKKQKLDCRNIHSTLTVGLIILQGSGGNKLVARRGGVASGLAESNGQGAPCHILQGGLLCQR